MNTAFSQAPDWRAYDAYGHSLFQGHSMAMSAFNGAVVDLIAGNYMLGNGHRVYNPKLMRFQSADSLSPFRRGGLNAYSYCSGDPVNRVDPSGRSSLRRFWQKVTGGPKKVQKMHRLFNTNEDRLEFEVQATDKNIKRQQAWLTVVNDSESMSTLFKGEGSVTHKWLVTDRGELIVGSFRHDETYSTHASFAHIAARDHGTSANVVAGGEFKMKGHRLIMTNYSGHYKTPYYRLWPVKMHMEQLGIEMKITRQSYLADQ
ncbi:RHS repeat-associated core domain-containing protein [Pseudomonas putida]|uniref:RHS repeat-associated core domain-containing protein n=1 Tax=Pseudomonas putida TaxID=303 RepID=UPI00117A72A3|nr:RHS repeat-associated core domain-containing protein [Pseudomonas putida]TRO31268.1 RHS repeat-associated core domain-containing protein [Pseudomonas putida]